MGLFDNGITGARARQKQSVIAEAAKAGTHVLNVVEHADGGDAARAAVGSSLKALFGGSMRVDCIQVFSLQTYGWPHTYAQPYAGVAALPGEHHGILHGALPSPAMLTPGIFSGASWEAGMPEVAKALDRDPHIKGAAQATKFEWPSGLSKVSLAWGVQLRSLGNGTTHVVMQAGRYGGLTSYEVGMAQWLRLCQALPSCLQPYVYPPQPFMDPPRWGEVIDAALSGPATVAPAAAPAAPPAQTHDDGSHVRVDYPGSIRSAMAPHLGKKVWVGEIPPKQLGNLHEHVIPPALQGSHILAAIDLTTFGSAKDAIVVTPTHLVAKEFDDVLTIELAAIRSVLGAKGLTSSKVQIEVDRLGTMSIPVGIAVEPVLALLTAIAQANAGGGTIEVSAFVGDAPQQVSMAQAQAIMAHAQAALGTDAVSDKINAAAQLLMAGQYQAAMDAYGAIAQQHPETTGTCYGQIGAALFFMQHYPQAIQYYEAAKHYGEDPAAMDANIAEAQGYLR
jgi:hypothetical protein